MKLREKVSFAGGLLDRCAAHRTDAAALHAARALGRVLPVWKGKPLFAMDDGALGYVAHDHPILDGVGAEVFLGKADGSFVFAADVSHLAIEDQADTMGAFYDPSVQRHPDLPQTQGFAELRSQITALGPLEAEIAATALSLLGWHKSHRFCACCGAQSTLADAGWRRLCPTCEASHFPRTDPVVIMLITRGNRVLVGRSHGWPEGFYSLLAGFVEPGETPEAAVRREVFEEAGITVGQVDYIASQPWPFPNSLMMGFQGEALTDAIAVDPAELDDAIWVSREEMVKVMAGAHPTLKPAREGAIAHSLLKAWLADH